MDDYTVAKAQYELWEAQHCGTPNDILRATSILNQLVAHTIHGAEVTE